MQADKNKQLIYNHMMKMNVLSLDALLLILLSLIILQCNSIWMPKEAAEWAVNEYYRLEMIRNNFSFIGTDRRSSAPFISGDTFRSVAPHICEDANSCRMSHEAVKDGECIFVKTEMLNYFVTAVSKRITNKYILISHNSDMSAPDGQDDAPRIELPKYRTSDILKADYESGKLLAHHGQNLWWYNKSIESRPSYIHCLPIGIPNRYNKFGGASHIYIDALKKNVINKPVLTTEELSKRPLLLIAFYPRSISPDRHKVLSILGAIPPKGQQKPKNPWYNETDLSHSEWLDAIGEHRFVLAPFGHGLDTHRISEILLMGGIPVMRRSTIASCYDDSDNYYNTNTTTSFKRGPLPIVVLDSWEQLNATRLEQEWEYFLKIPNSNWDWKRLYINHWLQRIGCKSE